MDGSRFDALVRGMGEGRTRRGFVGLLAALAAGGAVAEGEARRRRRCRKDSPAGQCCRKDGTCTCTDGGTVCGTNCCRMGQECQGGQCVAMPNPDTCVAYGEACKNVGIPCCEGLQCGSGQGGEAVACWVAKTGRCDSTPECIYGTECKDGICVGLPPAPTCVAEQCPACPVQHPPIPTASAKQVCTNGVCGCTCNAAGTGPNSTNGDSCSVAQPQCPTNYLCYDITVNSPCNAQNSAHCCCMKINNN